jgi:hypothetical protein
MRASSLSVPGAGESVCRRPGVHADLTAASSGQDRLRSQGREATMARRTRGGKALGQTDGSRPCRS